MGFVICHAFQRLSQSEFARTKAGEMMQRPFSYEIWDEMIFPVDDVTVVKSDITVDISICLVKYLRKQIYFNILFPKRTVIST